MNDKDLINELVNKYGWSGDTLAVWRRARYCCEYCKVDLIARVDDYLYGSHVDHIVPGGGEQLDNLALACKACNFIKSDKNFSEVDRVLTRDELISKAADFIAHRRQENEQRLNRVRDLLHLLDGSANGKTHSRVTA